MENKFVEFKNDFLGEKYTLINHHSGLAVYVFPKDRTTSWAILGTEYGSVDNCFYSKDDGKYIKVPEGIAHFLEHKMFDNEDGTTIDDMFSKLGADPNAYTSWEETGYVFTCNDNFYESLSLLVRFVMTPYFTKESIEKECGIIDQEIAMCEDDPYDRCFLNMVRGLYEKNEGDPGK
jgi:predicted Zn-dependent peptidase